MDGVVRSVRRERTLAEDAARRLRELILSGTLAPGTPLKLRPLAERFGVSVMPIREALRQLESEGLVHTRPHSGSIVAGLSRDELEELYAMRAALEGLGARIAALELTNAGRSELVGRLDAIDAAARIGDLERFLAADRAFHTAIYQVAHRPRLLERITDLAQNTRRVGILAYADWRSDPMRGVDAHRAILDAVLAGDADQAERLMTEHLRYGGSRVLRAVDAMAEAAMRPPAPATTRPSGGILTDAPVAGAEGGSIRPVLGDSETPVAGSHDAAATVERRGSRPAIAC